MKKQLKLLLVDFDGVLSMGRFYRVPDKEQNQIGEKVSSYIFSRENTTLVDRWMRGELTYGQVHALVERQMGIDTQTLDRLLGESIRCISFNTSLLRFISTLRSENVKVILFTNNMDIFDTVTREYHALDSYFDQVYSSSQWKQLKLENDQLLKRVIIENGLNTETTALVDDSPRSLAQATRYGVSTFLYEHYEASQSTFEKWLAERYTW